MDLTPYAIYQTHYKGKPVKRHKRLRSRGKPQFLQRALSKCSSKTFEYQRVLRMNQTKSEREFETILKTAGLNKYFKPQVPMFGFIVDFFSIKFMLAIEIDGITHDERKDYDELRTKRLKQEGVFIVRFSNQEVFNNPMMVSQKLWREVQRHKRRMRFTKPFHNLRSKVLTSSTCSQEHLRSLVPSLNG